MALPKNQNDPAQQGVPVWKQSYADLMGLPNGADPNSVQGNGPLQAGGQGGSQYDPSQVQPYDPSQDQMPGTQQDSTRGGQQYYGEHQQRSGQQYYGDRQGDASIHYASGNDPLDGQNGSNPFAYSDAHVKGSLASDRYLRPPDNPNGRGIILFVHGTDSNQSTFTEAFVKKVLGTYHPMHMEPYNWDASGEGYEKSTAAPSELKGLAQSNLNDRIQEIRGDSKYQGQPILAITHSNGGNVAVQAATGDPLGAPDYILRFAAPVIGDTSTQALDERPNIKVLDVFDPDDKVKRILSFPSGGSNPEPRSTRNWHSVMVHAPKAIFGLDPGIQAHLNIHTPEVWDQIQQDLNTYGFTAPFNAKVHPLPVEPLNWLTKFLASH